MAATFCKKLCAWLHGPPLHQNRIRTDLPPTSPEQFLKAIWNAASQVIVLILHQIKLNPQLSHCAFFSVNRTLKIRSLSHFQVYNTVLLTVVTMLYFRFTEFNPSSNWKFLPFDQHLISPMLQPLATINLPFFLWVLIYDFCLLNFWFCSCIVSWFYWIVFLYCSSLSFFKTTILNSLSGKFQISISLGTHTIKLLCSFGGVMLPWFFNVSCLWLHFLFLLLDQVCCWTFYWIFQLSYCFFCLVLLKNIFYHLFEIFLRCSFIVFLI